MDELLNRVDKIPTVNTVALKVIHYCSDGDVPLSKLVKVISGDQSLTSQILRVANSSYFNYPRKIYSLDRAIVIMGLNLLRDISLSISIFSLYKELRVNKVFDMKQFWRHSLNAGYALKVLANNYDPDNKELLYVGGLLHDIGKLILIRVLDEDYYLLLEKSETEDKELSEIEDKFLGFNHSNVGAKLLEKWNLPAGIIQMVENHHKPDNYTNQDKVTSWVRLAYLGNLLALLLDKESQDFGTLLEIAPDFEKYFSLSDLEINQYIKELKEEIAENEEFIKLMDI